MMGRRARVAVVALLTAVLAAACVQAPEAPRADVAPVDTADIQEADLDVRRDGVERRVRDGTLRVRARTCFGVGSGSGFAVADHLLATNRHVVAGADVVQLSTWDGTSIDVEITGVAVHDDLAVVSTRQPLPELLPQTDSPDPGAEVAVVGYPGGDAIEFSWGRVRDYVDGKPFGRSTDTMRVDARVELGNSGGPLVDRKGNVVGVVFAIEVATGHGLVIPIESLQAAARRSDSFLANPSPC